MGSTLRDYADQPLKILLLEDSNLDAELVVEHLQATGLIYDVDRAIGRTDFVRAVEMHDYDLILADFVLPGFDGMSALEVARARCPQTPFVFVSGTLGEEIAVEALKRGATDYVLKQRLERLPATVLRALAEARERNGRREAQETLRKLLIERTTLLDELDHRVKNNLQLLLSLVSHEMRQAQDGAVREALGRIKQRLQALGAVHRELYTTEEAAMFDAGSFARDLAQDLLLASGRRDIAPEFEIAPVRVHASKATPIALLLNEIVANALAHAYAMRHGKMRLSVRTSPGLAIFEVTDDVFTRAEKSAARESSSSAVLNALARQLRAQIEWPEDDPATLVRVLLPVDEAHIRVP